MDNKKIGSFIKQLRQENGMSQKDLADRIPINREAVSKWECGRTIPDSQTILILSKIFKVSIDELMYGEYKTKDNKDDIKNLYLQVYDDRNNSNKKLKKTTKFLLIVLALLCISIIGFLVYYFCASYDSVKIYTVDATKDNISLTDGIIVLTGENIYFRLGNLNGIDENLISMISVYYNIDNEKKIVYSSTSSKDGLIRDYYGYNEYFKIEDKGIALDGLYVDIYYDDEVITLKLNIKEDYSNKRLFFRKYEKSSIEKTEKIDIEETDLIKHIKEYLKYEDSGIYHQQIKIEENVYDVYYIEDTSTLLMSWEKDRYQHSIDYFPASKCAFYSKNDSNSSIIDECYYDENNTSKTTCDNSIIDILNLILNEIKGGRS